MCEAQSKNSVDGRGHVACKTKPLKNSKPYLHHCRPFSKAFPNNHNIACCTPCREVYIMHISPRLNRLPHSENFNTIRNRLSKKCVFLHICMYSALYITFGWVRTTPSKVQAGSYTHTILSSLQDLPVVLPIPYQLTFTKSANTYRIRLPSEWFMVFELRLQRSTQTQCAQQCIAHYIWLS